ncbi:MAG: hypothetical protein BWY71_02295 [Planctomycetes bacterium ADurb.Bin412]|nr:MAG: hypothetical protein BWY71_02295 [Planctomycetes bacterium ADurb.Bin412]
MLHLFGIAPGQLPFPRIEAVFQTNTRVSAQQKRGRAHLHLVFAGGGHRPDKIADSFFGRFVKENQILDGRGDTAQKPHDKLEINRLLNVTGFNHEGKIIDHGHIINLDFRLRSVLFKSRGKFPEAFEGIGENIVFRHSQIIRFPLEFKFIVLGKQRKQGHVDGTEIKRAQFRFKRRQNSYALCRGHAQPAAGRNAKNDIAAGLDVADRLTVQIQGRRGLPRFRIPHMNMGYRCAGLPGPDGFIGDLLRFDRQIGGHCGGMNSSRNGRGKNCFIGHINNSLIITFYVLIIATGRHQPADAPFILMG